MKIGSIVPASDASALEALLPRSIWEGMDPIDPTPMKHFIWHEACFATMYRNRKAVLLTTNGGIAAFVRKGALPTLFLAGAEELAEPAEAAYADAEAAERLADAILDHRLPVKLGQPPAGTVFADIFAAKAQRRGLLVTAPTEGSPYIELDESWKDALARFNSRRRADFRRMRRRAEEDGEVAFEFHEPRPDEAEVLLERAIEVEAKSWKSRTRTAIADNKVQLDFFRRYARLAAQEGIFRIAFMKIGPEIAAAQICAECDGSFWLFKIGYDERFARCSPGQLLMLESIQQAAGRGLKRYEFLGKAAGWTAFWASSERPRMKFNYYPWNLLGAAALVKDVAAMGRKKISQFIEGRNKERSQDGNG